MDRYIRLNSLNTSCFQRNDEQSSEEDTEGAEGGECLQSVIFSIVGPPFLWFLPLNFHPKPTRSIYYTVENQGDNLEVAGEIPGKEMERNEKRPRK